MKLTALLSGGLDSAVLLAALLEAEHHVRPVYVLPLAGGAGPSPELHAAEQLARHYDLEITRAQVEWPTEPPEGIMHLITLAGVAGAVALDHDDEGVAWASHGGKTAPQVHLTHVLRIALKVAAPSLELVTPFLDHEKAGLVTIGATLGVPFELTYSCDLGEPTHCGSCDSCRERHEAFVFADVPDPTSYVVEPAAPRSDEES